MANKIVDLELEVRELLQKGTIEAYSQAIKHLEKLRDLYDDKPRIANTNRVLEAIRRFRGLKTITPQESYLESIDPEYPGEERRMALSSAECQPTRAEIAKKLTTAQERIDSFLVTLQKNFYQFFLII